MRNLLILVSAWAIAGPASAADGAALFAARCGVCHSVTAASKPGGPSLKGVAGRKIASLAGYAYSPGLKAHGGTWTAASLDAFLAKPSSFAPGSKMFVSVPDPAVRAAIVTYLGGVK